MGYTELGVCIVRMSMMNTDLWIFLNCIQLECCGMNSYTDWFTTGWTGTPNSVPTSCCKDEKSTCKHTNLPNAPDANKTMEINTKVSLYMPLFW